MEYSLAHVGDHNFLLLNFLSPENRNRASYLYVGKNKVLGGILDYHLSLYEVRCVSFLIDSASVEPCTSHLEPSP
jgi:hypothetical protein